jgi:hypothetical protein
MAGDTLARGGKSATFGPARGISQEKWDAIWESDKNKIAKPISKPPRFVPLTNTKFY